MATREDSGTSQYHGMLVSVQRRATSGVNLAANYTWSHCIGDSATANATGRGGAGYLDPNNRRFDRGNCGGSFNNTTTISNNTNPLGSVQDRRHIFNATVVLSAPQFANPTMRKVGSGWQLSTIYRKSSGSFFSVYTGLDRVLSGLSANQRANQVLPDPYLDRDSLTYLNPKAFVQPDVGTIGNLRALNIEGPGTWALDMGLSRTFQFREKQKIEFRAEAFNLTNSFRRQNPSSSALLLNSQIFGQINGAYDARIMQFALKYAF
jgi:hypothetical protein